MKKKLIKQLIQKEIYLHHCRSLTREQRSIYKGLRHSRWLLKEGFDTDFAIISIAIYNIRLAENEQNLDHYYKLLYKNT